MINEFLVLASEVVLSAYPLLIKLVDASVVFQVGLRMLSFTVLAIAAALLMTLFKRTARRFEKEHPPVEV